VWFRAIYCDHVGNTAILQAQIPLNLKYNDVNKIVGEHESHIGNGWSQINCQAVERKSGLHWDSEYTTSISFFQ
jgi:hypothetical protein